MKRTRWMLSCLLLFACSGIAVLAHQQDSGELDADERKQLLASIETLVTEQLQKLLIAELLTEVDEYDRLFDLPDASVARLRLAARGAVTRAMEAVAERNAQTIRRMIEQGLQRIPAEQQKAESITVNGEFLQRVKAAPGNAEAPPPDPKAVPLRIILRGGSQYVSFTVCFQNGTSGTSLQPRPPELRTQDVWKKSVAAVLTADQLKQHAEYVASRLRGALVSILTEALVVELRLSDEQKAAVREVVSETITIAPGTSIDDPAAHVSVARRQLSDDSLDDILTPAQRTLFRVSQAYHARFGR